MVRNTPSIPLLPSSTASMSTAEVQINVDPSQPARVSSGALEDYQRQLHLLEQERALRISSDASMDMPELQVNVGPNRPARESSDAFNYYARQLKSYERKQALRVSPASGAASMSTPEPQVNVDLSQPTRVSLVGLDEHTKQLMMRVASGTADASETEQFQAQVQGIQSKKNISALREHDRALRESQDRSVEKSTGVIPSDPAYPVSPQRPATLDREMDDVSRQLADLSAVVDDKIRRLQNRRTLPFEKHPGRRSERDSIPTEAQEITIKENAETYTEPFLKFMTNNPTVFHAVDAIAQRLKKYGFMEIDERDAWDLKPSGSYFLIRNGSSMIAFTVGAKYEPGNGAAIIAGHVDALTAKLKPVSKVPNKAGYIQLGVAPYAGAPNSTWWDRDLGIGGRVLVKEGNKVVTKLVKLPHPIARIPTLAPHFGQAAVGPFNPETQMTPIIGLDSDSSSVAEVEPFSKPSLLGEATFLSTQPPRLAKAIAKELGIKAESYGDILNWELELFDTQPAQLGGLDKEFIFAGRIDDKLCSWSAIEALIESSISNTESSSQLKIVGLFDNEEIGSLLRQGARGNLLPTTVERIVGAFADHWPTSDLFGMTYANSFLLSADVSHAVNPNFLGAYLENHSPHLNTGLVVSADSNGHMTTDAVSTAILQRCAETVGAKLQVFQIRNDSRSGGTVGPMLSAATGMRAIDAGIPQLSMHSCRATTGSLDPGLGAITFKAFLDHFESIDKEFR